MLAFWGFGHTPVKPGKTAFGNRVVVFSLIAPKCNDLQRISDKSGISREKVGKNDYICTNNDSSTMATIKFRLSSKADKATGQSEVLVRFFHGRIDQYAKTNIFVDPTRWNPTGERVTIPRFRVMSPEAKQLTTELADTNTRLEAIKQHIQDAFMEAGAGKVQLPGSWLADLMQEYNFPKVEESRGVLDVMQGFNEGRECSPSHRNHYRVCWRAFKRFIIFQGYDLNMSLDDVTGDMIRAFLDYLRNEHTYFEAVTDGDGKKRIVFLNGRFKDAFQAVPESRLPVERGENAIFEFVKHFRTFYIWANDQGLTTNNPFHNLPGPQPLYGTPYYITVEERNHLMECDLSADPRLEVQRDIFVFQCVVGCRVSDLRHLTKDSVIDGAIEYIPRKTKDGHPHTVRVPLNAVARAILEKYKDTPGKALLPCISDQNYNYAIKDVFTACGLTRMVTVLNPTTRQEEKRPLNEVASSHLARRCFIGNLYKQVKDPNLIGKLSGHVEGSKAFARYRDIDEDMRRELVDMLV